VHSSAARRFGVRLVLLAGLWWALNPGDPASWIVGGPVVVLAAWAGAWLAARAQWSVRPLGLLRFIPFFLLASFRGGANVAWRALHPRLPIEPELMRYALRLPEGSARVFFIDVASLLPGTLSADLEGSTLLVHVLSSPHRARRSVAALEEHVAGLFGLDVSSQGGSP
jgi:multicomponent Na+:H+ antiporter subunit E